MTAGAHARQALPTCPACAAAVAPDADRCAACGSPLLAPQRRVVTLLFADLAGYTRLCASLDPEDVHLLVRPLMNGLRKICEDVGGVVPAIEGDGFMAVFGALRASEDDPLRAVTAAVHMQRAMAQRRDAYGDGLPGLRVGVNLGEVLVAPSWEGSGFSLSGDPVNVASRLCGIASPGEVVAASGVVAVLPSRAHWETLGEVEVRNRDDPVHAHRLAWQDAAVGPSQTRAPSTTPFVGRDAELKALAGHHALVIVGEPGVGKSRLVAEWVAHLAHRTLVAGCPSFAARGAEQVIADLVRPVADLADELLGPTSARRVRRLMGGDVEATEVDAVADQLRAGVELLRAVSAHRPLVVVVEDVHWASREVRELLISLSASADHRLGVVLTTRDTADDALPGHRVTLSPLSDTAVDALVGSLLPGADEVLSAALRSRSGGVPLYVEQCAQLLVEDGSVVQTSEGHRLVEADGLRRVPTSMRLFVAARLDLLGAAERSVLEAASVVGDSIRPELLRHLCRRDVGDEVESLLGRGLLSWMASADGPVLRFRHAVVRDVVYDGQLLAVRVDTHRAAAEWFGVRLPREALVGRAAHLEAALALLEGRTSPDCSLVAEAVRALTLLGHGQLTEDPVGAVHAVERGLLLVERHPECGLERLDLDLLLAEGCQVLGRLEESVAAGRRALMEAEQSGDVLGQARACLVLGRAQWTDDADAARHALDRAREHFAVRDDSVGLAQVEVEGALFGHYDGVAALAAATERAFHAAERAGDFRWSNFLAQSVAILAFAEGRPRLQKWLDIARSGIRTSDTAGRGRLVLAEASVDLYAHELDTTIRLARHARDLGTEAGVRHTVVNALVIALEATALAGDLDQAQRYLQECRLLAEASSSPMLALNTTLLAPLVLARLGKHAEAQDGLTIASSEVAGQGAAFLRDVRSVQARTLLDSGRFDEARDAVQEAWDACHGMDEPFVALRIRLLHMAASVSARRPTAESYPLQRASRDAGAPAIEGLAARWLELDDLLRGNLPLVTLTLPEAPPGIEGTALDHEVHAFLDQDWDRLLEASALWRGLGATVWPARPLCWYATLTGDESHLDDARQLLLDAGAPEGLEEQLRAQPMLFRRTLGE